MDRAELERQLTCVECGAISDGPAEGWRALLAGGVVQSVDVGALEVATYCPTRDLLLPLLRVREIRSNGLEKSDDVLVRPKALLVCRAPGVPLGV